MKKYILVFNAGSSSLKFELFDFQTLRSLYEYHFEEIGSDKMGEYTKKAFHMLQSFLHKGKIMKIGHRVVHGGAKYSKSTLISNKVIADIRKFSNLAPLHNPANLAVILACKKLFPKIPQVACFDTAFHHTIPEKAYLYALPRSLFKKYGVRKYGFHGLSHEYVFHEAQKKLGKSKTKRTITCHLGNGCSLTAILDGKSVDTTMGFTPLEGIPMGTRSGDIDPGIIFFLARKGWKIQKIEHMLQHESGFKGMAGVSDVRTVLKKAKHGNRQAKLALEIFCYRTAKAISGLTASLGGLDCLVFTGGIGEHAGNLRKKIVSMLPFHGFKILVVPTDEEKHIVHLIKS